MKNTKRVSFYTFLFLLIAAGSYTWYTNLMAKGDTPTLDFYDTNATDDEISANIVANLTATGSGVEFCDITWSAKVNGALADIMQFDASDGAIELHYTLNMGGFWTLATDGGTAIIIDKSVTVSSSADEGYSFAIDERQALTIEGTGDSANSVTGLGVSAHGAQHRDIDTPDLTGNSYSVDNEDYTVKIDDDDADVTGTVVVGLPAVATSNGRVITIVKIGSSETVQLDGNASETINGATTLDLTVQWTNYTIQCDGVDWVTIY